MSESKNYSYVQISHTQEVLAFPFFHIRRCSSESMLIRKCRKMARYA